MPVSLLPRSYVLRFLTFRIHEEELLHWSGLSGFLTWHARLLVQTRDPAVYRYRSGAVTEPQPAIFYGNDTAIRRAQALVDGKCARIIERGLWVKRRKDATLVERLRVSLDGRKNPLAERNPPVYYYSSRKYFFAADVSPLYWISWKRGEEAGKLLQVEEEEYIKVKKNLTFATRYFLRSLFIRDSSLKIKYYLLYPIFFFLFSVFSSAGEKDTREIEVERFLKFYSPRLRKLQLSSTDIESIRVALIISHIYFHSIP